MHFNPSSLFPILSHNHHTPPQIPSQPSPDFIIEIDPLLQYMKFPKNFFIVIRFCTFMTEFRYFSNPKHKLLVFFFKFYTFQLLNFASIHALQICVSECI